MTDNQREASRINGAKSHGPTTDEGRKRSSMNALKHGLTSTTQVVLNNEPREEFDLLRQGYFDRFQPADPVELDLVEQMVAASWRLRRVWPTETEAIQDAMVEATPYLERKLGEVPETHRTYFGMLKVMNNGFGIDLGRYESRHSRLYRRALQDLLKLRQQQPPASPPIETTEQGQPDPIPAAPSGAGPRPAQPQPALPKLLSALCALFLVLCSFPGSFCNRYFQAPPSPARVRFAMASSYRFPTSNCAGRATELTSGS